MGLIKIPTDRFIITASAIGILGSVIGLGLHIRAQHRVMKKPYVTDALKRIEENEAAAELIGRPIILMKPDVTDKVANQFGKNLVNVNVPFRGKNNSGILHIIADRELESTDATKDKGQEWIQKELSDEDWNIKRLELTFEKMPNKLLILYKRPEAEGQA